MSAEVGKDVEALCAKCGDVWHVVVAKEGEKIVKVQCKQCGAYHRHKAPTRLAKEAQAAKVKKPRAVKEPKAPVERFDRPLVAADLNKPVRAYKASEAFTLGERVTHVTFGEGVVEDMTEPGKMTVFFIAGRKVLVCAKPQGPGSTGLTRPKAFDHSVMVPGGKAIPPS